MTELERICLAALDRPAEERAAFLEDACHGDDALRHEIESLLAHASPADQFIEQPAVAGAGALAGLSGLSLGQHLGPYQILAKLGTGGMGEVYRAHDTQLGREVAIKILPVVFAMDPDRLARFEREARILASLNHPHIAAIYGVEADPSGDGVPRHALVMELIEGPTLAERIADGRLRTAEALTIARQIAEALEAAHEKGIVHRDLKPANVKVRPDGTVKVLDFGIAKEMETAAVNATLSPTITTPAMTQAGVILGTAAYMSPEQVRGEPVDKRTDIWAFGCVLYEMLTGRAAFAATSIAETFSEVLKTEPDWQRLPPETPEGVRRLLRRCLAKDSHGRLQDIGDARLEIDDATAALTPMGVAATPRRNTRDRVWWIAALIAGVVGAAAIARYAGGRQDQANEVRFEDHVPPTTDPTSFAISPDGKTLALVARSDGRSRLWLRSLDSLSARPLKGTENAKFPFWSPDSASVGFSADAQLKVIDLDSESVRVLVSGGALGGTWNEDGTIVFDRGPGYALFRVSADGGEPTAVTQTSQEATDPWFPQFLTDQRHFLFYATGSAPGIYIGELGASGTQWLLDAEAVAFASTGHLLFVRQGTLFAQVFDPVRLKLVGSPTAVAEGLVVGPGPGGAALSASAAGPIVYRTGRAGTQSHFVWFDRSGNELETVAGSDISAGYNSSLSPDSTRLAMSKRSGTSDIWLVDLDRGVPERFTFDPQDDLMPVWSPKGERIAFSSNRKRAGGRGHSVYVKPATGLGADELLVDAEASNPSDWSSDGRFILLVRSRSGQDIWALPLDGDRKAFPVVETMFNETNGQFSPDSQWVAYQSDRSGPGQVEIYVERFLGPGGRKQVSSGGGVQVRWRYDGKELFYLTPDNQLMAVPIELDSAAGNVKVGTPESLFTPSLSGTPQNYMGRHYMVSRDGQRFLMDTLKEVALPITVILNWKPEP